MRPTPNPPISPPKWSTLSVPFPVFLPGNGLAANSTPCTNPAFADQQILHFASTHPRPHLSTQTCTCKHSRRSKLRRGHPASEDQAEGIPTIGLLRPPCPYTPVHVAKALKVCFVGGGILRCLKKRGVLAPHALSHFLSLSLSLSLALSLSPSLTLSLALSLSLSLSLPHTDTHVRTLIQTSSFDHGSTGSTKTDLAPCIKHFFRRNRSRGSG